MPHADPEARREWHKRYYQRNRDKALARAARQREVHAEEMAAYHKQRHAKLQQDPEFRERVASYNKKRRRENRDHVREIERASYYRNHEKRLASSYSLEGTPERSARVAVRNAIRRGALPRAKTLVCVSCSGPAKEYHHHKGYAQEHWLDVVAVCHQCHKDIHFSSDKNSSADTPGECDHLP